jgi:biopolymer transport protein ExbD
MRKLRFRDNSEGATFDLNLAPMMDMMVSIIPFMLLSATFLQVMLINAPLPAPVAQALKQDRDKDKREVSIKVQMHVNQNFVIDVKEASGKTAHYAVVDTQSLHKKLVEIKQSFPKVFRLELNPDSQVDYKSIVQVMDSTRSMENADPKITIEGAETPLLFPDVILANVVE